MKHHDCGCGCDNETQDPWCDCWCHHLLKCDRCGSEREPGGPPVAIPGSPLCTQCGEARHRWDVEHDFGMRGGR